MKLINQSWVKIMFYQQKDVTTINPTVNPKVKNIDTSNIRRSLASNKVGTQYKRTRYLSMFDLI